MPKAIVTGASGFVGSNLARYLVKNDWEVSLIVRFNSDLSIINDILENVNIFRYDGKIQSLVTYFQNQKAEVVFHIASLFIAEHKTEDVDNLVDSNLRFGLHLLEAMSKSKTKLLINTGTSWQHYNNEEYNPVDLYAATKEAFEKLTKYYVEAEELRCITLKLFDTYGENDPRPKLLNLLSKFANEGKTLDMSHGEQLINLVHIDDVVQAFVKSYKYLNFNPEINYKKYAVASPDFYTLKELIELFNKKSKRKIIVNWGARKYRKREVMDQITSIERLPNWAPTVTFSL